MRRSITAYRIVEPVPSEPPVAADEPDVDSDHEPEPDQVPSSEEPAADDGDDTAEEDTTETEEELAKFSENDVVRYGDGDDAVGIVVDVVESTFVFPDEDGTEIDASSDNPAYIVARGEGGTDVFRDGDLEKTSNEKAFGKEDPDIEAIGEAKLGSSYEELEDVHDPQFAELAVDKPGLGWDSYPPSWRKSKRPNRIILLDAWTSMGASFDGCVREMRSSMVNPNRFCAATKDEVYGTTSWRGGWSD